MSAHIVTKPDEHDGLGDGRSGQNEKDGHVTDRDGKVGLEKENYIADCAGENAEHGEGVAVLKSVR